MTTKECLFLLRLGKLLYLPRGPSELIKCGLKVDHKLISVSVNDVDKKSHYAVILAENVNFKWAGKSYARGSIIGTKSESLDCDNIT